MIRSCPACKWTETEDPSSDPTWFDVLAEALTGQTMEWPCHKTCPSCPLIFVPVDLPSCDRISNVLGCYKNGHFEKADLSKWFKMIGNYVPSFVGTVCRLGLTLFDTRTLGMHCGFTRSVAWTAWKWFQQCLGRLRLFGPGFGLASVQKCRRRHLNFELVGIHYIISYSFILFHIISNIFQVLALNTSDLLTVIAFCSSCFPLSMAVTMSTWPSAQTEQTQHARHTVQICTVFAKHSVGFSWFQLPSLPNGPNSPTLPLS